MRRVHFNSILIADIVEKTAYLHQFSKGINVITSKENHVGKSSLLKSLYYSMGAEVVFDDIWNKNTKLCILEFCVDEQKFKIVRLGKAFALFNGLELILITNSVSQELAKTFEDIFSFSIYIRNKKHKKIELAPPVFTFMPYYIDQDSGWNGLYDSFANIDQYAKPDRIKSLYYHLGLYTLSTVELMDKRDTIKEKIEQLKRDEDNIRITLDSLYPEIQNLVPADSMEELERNLKISKEYISSLVDNIGRVRNSIEKLQTDLFKHEYKLGIVKKYKVTKDMSISDESKSKVINKCPKCGYDFDDEIYNMVHSNYNIQNSEYMYALIEKIVFGIKLELEGYKKNYVDLMRKLEEHEQVCNEKQDSYGVYLRQRGLQNTIENLNNKLVENIFKQNEHVNEIKKIEKELKKIPDKERVEEIYGDNVRNNIIKLGAWNNAYEGKIKLLKAIKAQGTLETKIILSQMVGIFQTMEYFKTNTISFPLVIDSPRSKEASCESSRDILKLIFGMDLPQVILATIDYEDLENDVGREVNVDVFAGQGKLLKSDVYDEHRNVIRDFQELLCKL